MHPRNQDMALEEFGLEKRNFNSTEFGAAVVRCIDQVPGIEVRWVEVPRRRTGKRKGGHTPRPPVVQRPPTLGRTP